MTDIKQAYRLSKKYFWFYFASRAAFLLLFLTLLYYMFFSGGKELPVVVNWVIMTMKIQSFFFLSPFVFKLYLLRYLVIILISAVILVLYISYVLLKRIVPSLCLFISIFLLTLSSIIYSYETREFSMQAFLVACCIISLIFIFNSISLRSRRKIISFPFVFPILLLLPVISELLFTVFTLQVIRDYRKKRTSTFKNKTGADSGFVFSMAAGCSLVIACLIPSIAGNGIFQKANDREVKQLQKDNFYSLEIVRSTGRLFACSPAGNKLFIYDTEDILAPPYRLIMNTAELQDIRIDEEKRILYHYDRGEQSLYSFNLDNYDFIASSDVLPGSGSARVEYNRESRTIAVTRENDAMWVLDGDSLETLKHFTFQRFENEYIKSDPYDDRYYLTHHRIHPFISVFHSGDNKFEDHKAGVFQGALEVSGKRNEIFVALPLQSRILVMDRTTMEEKYSIPTLLGVRGLGYDEENDILVAGSMCNGYIDIIELEPIIKHTIVFVDFFIREIALKLSSREAFISSNYGLYHVRY